PDRSVELSDRSDVHRRKGQCPDRDMNWNLRLLDLHERVLNQVARIALEMNRHAALNSHWQVVRVVWVERSVSNFWNDLDCVEHIARKREMKHLLVHYRLDCFLRIRNRRTISR